MYQLIIKKSRLLVFYICLTRENKSTQQILKVNLLFLYPELIMTEKRKIWHWVVLAVLSLIWGTSYILMKKGLESFSAFQVGSLRILITFLCLLPIALKNFHKLNRTNIILGFHYRIDGKCNSCLSVSSGRDKNKQFTCRYAEFTESCIYPCSWYCNL